MIQKKHVGVIILFICCLFCFSIEAAQQKIIVIVDDSSIKDTPNIRGKTLVKVALNTVFNAEGIQGEWYKVTMQNEGVEISGYIHEMLVKAISEEELSALGKNSTLVVRKTEEEIIAEIATGVESNKARIREGEEVEEAIVSLRSMVARAFRITDQIKQRELVVEIYLWIGMAFVEQGKKYAALKEMRNMFEVEHSYALEITRNIVDTGIIGLINQAEKEYTGELTEYSVEVVTEPELADIFINGSEIGSSPVVYSSMTPQIDIEIKKNGYKAISESIFLTTGNFRKVYSLERLGINVAVISIPNEAKVYLDGKYTGKTTNCILDYVPFGKHDIGIKKENYSESELSLIVEEGSKPLQIDAVLLLNTYEFVRKWESGLFEMPAGIAMDTDSNFYVIDESKVNVKKFNSNGMLQRSWKIGGRGFPGLKAPTGIAVDNNGFIYISDTKKHCVMKFNKNGQFLLKWGKEGTKPDEFRNPSGIAVNNNYEIYIADSGNNRIKKYLHTGVLKKVYGKPGLEDGNFVSPVALAFNQDNELLILDRIRVQKFSSDLEFLSSLGKEKFNELKLNTPKGICIDEQNCYYLADSGNNRVLKFDKNGDLISELREAGTGMVKFNYPVGLTVDKKGRIYVVERGSNRMQLFGVPSKSKF